MQVCQALDKEVLHVDIRSMSLGGDPSREAEEHLLRRQLCVVGRLTGTDTAALSRFVSQCVASIMQAAGLPCFQPSAVSAWLDME